MLRLDHLDKHLASTPKDQLEQLQAMFSQNTCEPLIQFATEASRDLGPYEQESYLQHIYEFAFEYAISQNAKEFIETMLLQKEILNHIDQIVLLNYAKKQNLEFKRKALIAMANADSRVPYIEFIFRTAIRNIVKRANTNIIKKIVNVFLPIDEDEFLIQSILFNPGVMAEKQNIYLKEWIETCLRGMSKSSNQQAIINMFFQYFPRTKNEENTESLTYALVVMISQTFDVMKFQGKTILNKFFHQYLFSSDEIVNILESESYNYHSFNHLILLIERIDKNHHKYKNYMLIRDFLNLPPESQRDFLLAHPRMLSREAISQTLQYRVLATLAFEAKKSLLKCYIDSEDFECGRIFKDHIFSLDTNDFTRYLLSKHTELPALCLKRMVNESASIAQIKLLLDRPDYVFKKEDLFYPLFVLFQKSDLDSIHLLLNHPSVINLLKQYHQLRGDDELSTEERGTLMPMVLAWYIKFSDIYKEIFLSIPQNYRDAILKNCVPSFIEANQPTLRAFIIQTRKFDLIEEIGGINPRLLNIDQVSGYTAYVPTLFQREKALKYLHKMQRNMANQAANKHSQQLHFAEAVSDIMQDQARLAMQACQFDILTLQHETDFSKVKSISLEGCLKTRRHIQGLRLTGKASNGLTKQNSILDNPKSDFTFFTRVAAILDEEQSKMSLFSDKSQSEKARFIFNGRKLFEENPHITFIVFGPSQFFNEKRLKLTDDYTVISDPSRLNESYDKRKLDFSTDLDATINGIHQILFELVFIYLIDPMPELIKAEVIQRLTHPASEKDYQLAQQLIDLLHLEWLIPGDIPLKFTYVDKIEYGDKTYDLAKLRQLVLNGNESDILADIDAFANINDFPFVLKGIFDIACKRKQAKVMDMVLELEKRIPHHDDHIIYYPNEVYQIESLAQLILEDLNNDRVYVRYSDNKISIQSILHRNSNRSGAHHAEMAKLHFALGIGNLEGRNALNLGLSDHLDITISDKGQFKSLAAMRDAMLTHEVINLLVSKQNQDFYIKNKGAFHPQTGKGATNGVVALLEEKLFDNGVPYHVTVTCDDKKNKIIITTDKIEMASHIADSISNSLGIRRENINVDENIIVLDMPAADLIAKLRQQATFYEGINVITEDGRLLLAERHGKGLASAGGHHSNKYCGKDITHGLRSEFGLEFRLPETFEDSVTVLTGIKTISKTGIYVVSESALQPTAQAQNYATEKKLNVAFHADPEEFVSGSEVALTLSDMRDKKFYDVMPLAELCHYQLNALKQGLNEYFPESCEMITLAIDNQVDSVVGPSVTYKVPGPSFGRLKISVNGELSDALKELFEKQDAVFDKSINAYVLDQSPMLLLQVIKREKIPAPSLLRA